VERHVTEAFHDFAGLSRLVTPSEPRVTCPCCGAHVIVSLRVSDRMFMACPVCELRWAEDNPVRHDSFTPRARE